MPVLGNDRSHLRDVDATTEHASGAGEHDHTDGVVGLGVGESAGRAVDSWSLNAFAFSGRFSVTSRTRSKSSTSTRSVLGASVTPGIYRAGLLGRGEPADDDRKDLVSGVSPL